MDLQPAENCVGRPGAIGGWSSGGKTLVWEKSLLNARNCKGCSFPGGRGIESEGNRSCRH